MQTTGEGVETSINVVELQPSAATAHVPATARPRPDRRKALGWTGAAAACLAIGWTLLDASPGPLSRHMIAHVVLMNVVAPLLALAIVATGRGTVLFASGRSLVAATTVQLALLWAWHAPAAVTFSSQSVSGHALMQASLSGASLWFWLTVIGDRSAFRWRVLFALLLTGKLFCLLGILLVFAPRLLYGQHTADVADVAAGLADQHLAGLTMLIVCPLTYVLAGVVIAAQWLAGLERPERDPGRFHSPENSP